jgi:hypothetical protein
MNRVYTYNKDVTTKKNNVHWYSSPKSQRLSGLGTIMAIKTYSIGGLNLII